MKPPRNEFCQFFTPKPAYQTILFVSCLKLMSFRCLFMKFGKPITNVDLPSSDKSECSICDIQQGNLANLFRTSVLKICQMEHSDIPIYRGFPFVFRPNLANRFEFPSPSPQLPPQIPTSNL